MNTKSRFPEVFACSFAAAVSAITQGGCSSSHASGNLIDDTSNAGAAGGESGTNEPDGGASAGGAGGADGTGGFGGDTTAECGPGFIVGPDGSACVLAALCAKGNGGCDPSATCTEPSAPGKPPSCTCKDGYLGDGRSCAPAVTAFSVGQDFVCAIAADKSLSCWGNNQSGQLGNGSTKGSAWTPQRVSQNLQWNSVAAGYAHACGISDGALYCWGRNDSGALGLGDSGKGTERRMPERVGAEVDWLSVSAGANYTCGIRSNGGLYCWGTQTGSAPQAAPTRLGTAAGWTTVVVGNSHTCGLLNGSPYCWGSNQLDTLGVGAGKASAVAVPTQVDKGTDWVDLTASTLSTCGLRKSGQLYCWGLDGNIPLGAVNSTSQPTRVGNWTDWTQFSLHDPGGCGLRGGGEVWCFGSNDFGERGTGTPDITALTRAVDEGGWMAVRSGYNFACALKAGALSCWGHDDVGQLGVGNGLVPAVTSPTKVGKSNGWTHVDVGPELSCALQASSVYCWGDRQVLRYPLEPTQVGMGGAWSDVSVGYAAIVAHRHEQLLWWRFSPAQRDGYAAKTDPQVEGNGTGWHSARTSDSFDGPTCAIDGPDDTLSCYGPSNGRGQLGVGDTDARSTPELVGSTKGWQAVSPGDEHTCGIRAGLLYCWGGNDWGQLGLGQAKVGANQLSPQLVGAAGSWTAVAAGFFHTCGIQSGKLYCWGSGGGGLLGLGEVAAGNYPAPNRVGDFADWAAVSVSEDGGCAIRTGGELYCWGDNAEGQLGLGDEAIGVAATSPQQVGNEADWAEVSRAQHHTCGLQTDGTIWCWGSNASGQLGLGASWTETPMPVAWK